MGVRLLLELADPVLERGLSDTGIDASRLILEVTETAAIENMEEARAFADRLAALGCRLALDYVQLWKCAKPEPGNLSPGCDRNHGDLWL